METHSDDRMIAALAERLVPQLHAGVQPEDMDDLAAGEDRVIAYGAALLPVLESAAASPDPMRRAMAADLAMYLPGAGSANGLGEPLTPAEMTRGVRLLTSLASDPDMLVRRKACDSFPGYRHYAASAIPVLTGLLDDADAVAWPSADALGSIGAAAKMAAPRMYSMFLARRGDPDQVWFCNNLLKNLGRVEADIPEHVPILTEVLNEPDDYAVEAATQALGGYSRLPPATVARLRVLAGGPPGQRLTLPAKLALARGAGDAEAAAYLIDLAAGRIETSDGSDRRSTAIHAIARLPDHSAKVRPVLQALLNDRLLDLHAETALKDFDAATNATDPQSP